MYNNKFRNLVTSHRHMINPIFCKVKHLNSQKRTIHYYIWCATYILDIYQVNRSKKEEKTQKTAKKHTKNSFGNSAYL